MSTSVDGVGGRLVQPVDRHDRKEVADRPVVEQRLEDREVAEILVGELGLERLELFGPLVVGLAQRHDAPADLPEERLDGRLVVEREITVHEQRLCLVLLLERVVVGLERVHRRQIAVDLAQTRDDLVLLAL